ncbi:MAG TPA: hypothetical protein VJ890_03380 [Vineibacter sp.]|nr:hypothetical protein [Vineibacter sp.]
MNSTPSRRSDTGAEEVSTPSATERHTTAPAARQSVHRHMTLKMAIALPVVGFLLGVIVTEAQYYGTVHNLRALAREAGRATAMAATPEERRWVARETVSAAVNSYPLLDSEHVTVHVTEDVADPKRHDLTLTYAARPLGLWLLAGLTQRTPMTVQQSLTIRQGSY